jgi:hypothetical protein
MRLSAFASLFLAAASLAAQQQEKLPLPLQDATRRALERNTTLAVERESLAQAGFSITGAKGAYDPFLEAAAGWRKHTDPVNSTFSGAPAGSLAPENESATASASVTQLLPTGGSVQLFSDWGRDTTDNTFALLSPAYTTAFGVSARQPILRNLAIDPAREAIRVASAERNASAAALAWRRHTARWTPRTRASSPRAATSPCSRAGGPGREAPSETRSARTPGRSGRRAAHRRRAPQGGLRSSGSGRGGEG